MSVVTALLFSIIGFVTLTLGADGLVRGASRLAAHFRVSPVIVGLTVVAYGTSAPEIVASVVAAVRGHADVTVGNVIGSNVANMGLILGGTALATPLAVASSLLRRELPFMLAVTFLLGMFAYRLELDQLTGTFFVALLVLFNYVSFHWAKRDRIPRKAGTPRPADSLIASLLLIALGLGLLFAGGHLLVTGAVRIARYLGVSEFIIGVTLVAVGTSLPELATSFAAGLRKETELVVGNIVGSNLFNILGALGLSAMIRPLSIRNELLHFELPALIFFSLAMGVFLYTGRKLERWEGFVLLAGYAGFIALVFR